MDINDGYLLGIKYSKEKVKAIEECAAKRKITISKLQTRNSTDTPIYILRFDQEYKRYYQVLRWMGINVTDWMGDDAEGTYVAVPRLLMIAYAYLLVMVVLGTSITIFSVILDGNENHNFHDFVQASGLLFSVSIVPSIQVYSIKLIFQSAPKFMIELGILHYHTLLDQPDPTPIKHLLTFGILSKKHSTCLKKRTTGLHDTAIKLPFIMIVISVGILILGFVISIILTVDSSVLADDWESFVIFTTTCIIFPIIFTVSTLLMINHLETVYHSLYRRFISTTRKNIQLEGKNVQDLKKWIKDIEQILILLKLLIRTIEKAQDKFLRFIVSICLFTYLILALMCCVRLFKNVQMIIFLVPLFMSIYLTAVLCNAAQAITNRVSCYLFVS